MSKTMIITSAVIAPLMLANVASATTVLKLTHFAAESHPAHIAATQMAENMSRRTNGEVTIKIYPANSLGSPPEQLEQTILGVTDMNLPTQGALDKYEKAFATVMSPFAFRDYKQAHEVLDGPFNDWVAPKLEKQGLILLSNWEYGFRNITNNKRPINSPEDLKGIKLRTPSEIQLVAAMEAAGASATQIAFPELPMALNSNVVDGQENPIGVIYHYKLFEIQKYLSITRHSYNSMVNVINKDSFDRLTKNQQKILMEESKKSSKLMRKLVADQETAEIIAMEKLGLLINYPDPSEFKKVMAPAYDRIAEYAGKENMDKFLSLIK
ncbi:C4-dicarboxylate ABC transporter substrate-binding protein [Marinomonas ushuaiensis DSM 15871]|uniref:C4-dicarboxylate ABC transporter substrate-binding protein n=1 Tax=Marinomonas ushuaiensis DSM 15871 TaxID=1122207 RepID=X7E8G2_9GAMM|nr:C4-dicarboxylate ABC transporter substrate-binding protein [Marinomonas ushuaiensis DSM 15871]